MSGISNNNVGLVIHNITRQIDAARSLTYKRSLPDQELVHELRKALKRIRALLKMLAPLMNQKEYFRLEENLRRASQIIALQRDSVIDYETFQEFLENSVIKVKAETIIQIIDFLITNINRAYSNSFNFFDNSLDHLNCIMQKFSKQLHMLPIKDVDISFFVTNIEKSYLKAYTFYQHAKYSTETEITHSWRKSVKRLFLQLKFNPFFPVAEHCELSEILNEFTDLLGKEHDLTVLGNLLTVAEFINTTDKKLILNAIEEKKRKLLKSTFLMAGAFFARSDLSHIQSVSVTG
jgi:CHAD domain-containing protein